MTQEYSVATPEAVTIRYPIAGIGSRFLAAMIDAVIWIAAMIVIIVGSLALFGLGSIGSTAAIILFSTLSFVLLYGYYILFETLWRGQTPGKRAIGVRVITTAGYPIGLAEAGIRNLVRIVDFLPVFYGVGVVSMFISSQSRRLGDYAAGTMVVRERTALAEPPAPMPIPGLTDRIAARGAIDPEELSWDLAALSPMDLQLVRDFVDRAPALPAPARQRIGDEIAGAVAVRIGARPPLDPVHFARRVLQLIDTEG